MSRITEACKAGERAGRRAYAYYATCNKVRRTVRLALDQAPNEPEAMQKLLSYLKRVMPPETLQIAMQILRGETPELPPDDEDWSTDDPPLQRPAHEREAIQAGARDRYGVHGMDAKAEDEFFKQFPDARRIKGGIVAYTPQASGYGTPRRRTPSLAMDDAGDAEVRRTFDEMYVTGKRGH